MESTISALPGLCAHGGGAGWISSKCGYVVVWSWPRSPSSLYLMSTNGGCIQAVLVLKYVVPEYPIETMYFGIANVLANGLIMLR